MSEQVLTSAFTRLRNRLLRSARTMLPSLEDAEDALQDAFVRLWPHADQMDTERDVEALARVTIRRLAIDFSRNQKSLSPTDLLQSNYSPPSQGNCGIGAIGEASADGGQVGGESSWGETLAEAELLMERVLTPLQRDIIRLKEYDDRPYSEVAAMLNMQEAAVRMQLSRARKRLREEWKKSLP